MTEETKELINCIRVNLRHNKCFGGIDEIECKLLLDCITNLQKATEQTEIYKSRCEKANDFIDNYDVFKEFSFPLMKRDVENQIKSSIDYEFNSTFRKKLKNILNGSDEK